MKTRISPNLSNLLSFWAEGSEGPPIQSLLSISEFGRQSNTNTESTKFTVFRIDTYQTQLKSFKLTLKVIYCDNDEINYQKIHQLIA